jgi:8-oxo-dGTP pyrophosphatase MutT (NUDIX family)
MNLPGAPRPAATIVVVRDAPAGLEVLLLRRAEKGDHNSGAWVFPGGLLDAGDRRCHAACNGLDDARASVVLGLPEGGLDYYVAAIRESFEEAGILFAVDQRGQPIDTLVDSGTPLAALREPLHRGDVAFADVCHDFGLRLAADQLFYIAHWVTPPGRAKRFDTRFFLAVLPQGQTTSHDELETVDHVWLRPVEALSSENSRRLMTPTRSVIATIGRFERTQALLAWARSPREVLTVAPRLGRDSAGVRPVQPHEPAWAELGFVDPHGQGTAWCELRPGQAAPLAPGVLRVTAPGGANSYLVGTGEGWAAIDPGPADASHLAALAAAAPGGIRAILCTSGAPSEGAQALHERTGAPLQRPDAGETIALAGGQTLRVLAPAGTAGRRMFLLVEHKILLTGDLHEADALPAPHPGVEWLAPAAGFLRPAPRPARTAAP